MDDILNRPFEGSCLDQIPRGLNSISSAARPILEMTLRFLKSSYGLLFFPVLLTFIVHANVLFNGFGWDDHFIIQNLKSPEDWIQIFSFNPGPDSKGHAAYYRPLIDLSYQLDLLIWGDSPLGFHLSVLIAHLLNIVLVYFLALRLMKIGQTQRPARLAGGGGSTAITLGGPPESGRNILRPTILIPTVAASLFAVHPIHTEAVAWIAGRNDVYCTFFLLVSFVLYVWPDSVENQDPKQGRFKKGSFYGFSMIFFFLALLTKEEAVGLFLMFPLYDTLRHNLSSEKKVSLEIASTHKPLLSLLSLRWIVPMLIMGFYFTLRSTRVHAPYGGTGSIETFISLSTINNAVAAAALYIKMMIFPFPHAPFIGDLPHGFKVMIMCWMGFILVLSLGIIAVLRHKLLPAIGISWTLFFLAPPPLPYLF